MIIFDQVTKKYDSHTAVDEISLKIEAKEFTFLVGPSGAGKSTVLKLLIREELPTTGKVTVNQWDLSTLSPSKIPLLRRKVGSIFQDFKLLPKSTVKENVSLPLEITGLNKKDIEKKVSEVLEITGLGGKEKLFPHQLSGGESQRTAIARALVLEPEIILADEPTGNLDTENAWEVMKQLIKLNELGTTILMATHNIDFVNTLPYRVVEIQEGKVIKDFFGKGKKE